MISRQLIALCAFAFFPFAPAGAQPASVPAIEMSAETRLPHISIKEAGSGAPIVLIPGLASPREVWSGALSELVRGRRVILVQVNGFAGDDPGANHGDDVLPGIVDDVAAYLRSQNIEEAAIIGHSMGGLIGMMLTRQHPGLVGRLMVVDALPFFGMLFGSTATADTVRPVAEQMRSALIAGTAPTEAPSNMSVSEAGRLKVTNWLRAADRKVVGQTLYEDFVTDLRPALAQVQADRVHILYGVPNGAMAAMARDLYGSAYRGLPAARLVPIEGSAHFVMLDQPDRFLAAVRDFLADD